MEVEVNMKASSVTIWSDKMEETLLIGQKKHLRHHSVKTASFEIGEVSKLSVDVIPWKQMV